MLQRRVPQSANIKARINVRLRRGIFPNKKLTKRVLATRRTLLYWDEIRLTPLLRNATVPHRLYQICFLAVIAALATAVFADEPAPSPATRPLPGLQPDRSVLLPNQWSLRPAGRQVELENFPVNIAVRPQGDYAAVLHSGYGPHVVSIVDLRIAMVVSSVTLPKSFYGICFSPSGKRLLVSGGESDIIYRFHFSDGRLSQQETVELPRGEKDVVPTGMAYGRDGMSLLVACCLGNVLKSISMSDPASQQSIDMPAASYPYTVLPSKITDRLYVSLWGKAAIAVVDLKSKSVEAIWPAAAHPTEMLLSPDESLLYVACADSNSVVVLDTETGRQVEVIRTALYPKGPGGCTPMSLALAPNGQTLWIANADANNLAVIDVSERGESRSLGFIPVGWYPTSVRLTPDADRILVANGKGVIPKANPQGPNPTKKKSEPDVQYIGGLLHGTLSVVPMPGPREMPKLTHAAYGCSPMNADAAPTGAKSESGDVIPTKVGQPSPIKHCIYIIKENRTYDQVLGDVRAGNGDPSLCLFPERITPNEHALARQFVLLDNFYVDGEVSANGHEWSTAAYANDWVEKVWPQVYRRSSEHKDEEERGFPYPSQAHTVIGCAASGYIWDRCREAGVEYRNYGEFVENADKPGDPGHARIKALEGHFDPLYRAFDLDYSDQRRADRFIEELHRFETEGKLPGLSIVWLPNDHTSGTSVGKPTPAAYVADNDLALGRIVEAVSHSKFWKDTAIFVLEDDAQNGPDHVDAHRSTAYVISPYTKHRAVDSNMYSTSSMLRTMELILGLKPMTQFDAAALPMYASFQAKADLTPYEYTHAHVDLNDKNTVASWGAAESGKMDFRDADAGDDRRLNEIIWRSVRGAKRPMPAPVHAAFVWANRDGE
jgi:YVTN family beta-propeller protein